MSDIQICRAKDDAVNRDDVLAAAASAIAVITALDDSPELYDQVVTAEMDDLPAGVELAWVARIGDMGEVRRMYGREGLRWCGLVLAQARWL